MMEERVRAQEDERSELISTRVGSHAVCPNQGERHVPSLPRPLCQEAPGALWVYVSQKG